MTEQTSVATGFQAHMFEFKRDTLTNSMLKYWMSDALARLALEEDALLEGGGQSKLTPLSLFSLKNLKVALNWANFLTRTCLKTRRTVD